MTDDRKIRLIVELGCLICRDAGIFSPAEFHHILTDGRRRVARACGYGLCPPHHRGGVKGVVSRHPSKRTFERHYGLTEWQLYERALVMIGERSPGVE